jgi:DNA-binding transcriptional LysR family regulator
MTLEQLRSFLAAAERQHVTRAAEALHLTQSAVSSALTTLEGRHAVALFDRVGRQIVLNQAGAIFLVEARAVLARASAAEAALADLADLSRGRLSIHASQTIASYWLPPLLVGFHRAYAGIALDVSIGNTAEVATAVADGASELGLVEGEVDVPALSRAVIDHDRLCLVVGRDHPWARDDRPQKRDLTETPWGCSKRIRYRQNSLPTEFASTEFAPTWREVIGFLRCFPCGVARRGRGRWRGDGAGAHRPTEIGKYR